MIAFQPLAVVIIVVAVWVELGQRRLRQTGQWAFAMWMLAAVPVTTLLPIPSIEFSWAHRMFLGGIVLCGALAATIAILTFRPASRVARALLTTVAIALSLPAGLFLGFLAARMVTCSLGPCAE